MSFSTLRSLGGAFFHLFFPHLCAVCQERPPTIQNILCTSCCYQLPETGYHLLPENRLTERFWGRLPLQFGAAYYFFQRGGRAQQLIHQLKYHRWQEIGTAIGYRYGQQLRHSPHFPEIDSIIPVPLHPRKLRQRGFNQSLRFAEGLGAALSIPVADGVLERVQYGASQTHKSREERQENIQGAFRLSPKKAETLRGKHLLLVDDVLTTGATLEAAGQQLLAVEGTRLSVVTMAMAE